MQSGTRTCFPAISFFAKLSLTVMLVSASVGLRSVQAQTFKVIHDFTGQADGANSYAGLTMDRAGNLYGTTVVGGAGSGVVFKLRKANGSWISMPLYSFQGGTDGAEPLAGVTFGSDGTLYGTTARGGSNDQGTVFNLRPAPQACKTALCPWTETVLYRFQGGSDGATPNYGDLLFDKGGNIFGVTIVGGANGQGTVYELMPSKGGWTEKVLYSFSGAVDGGQPFAGLMLDGAGNLYGATQIGGPYGYGTVYELMPSGSGWIEKTLYAFQGGSDGASPVSSLILDQSGNLYGTTCSGGDGGGGTVYEMVFSNGNWMLSTLHSFDGNDCPWASPTMDAARNIYGARVNGGDKGGVCFPSGCGTVYRLTPSGGGWSYTDLHEFNGLDGQNPYGHLILDASGILYGTTANGGTTPDGHLSGLGVVFEITP